MTVFVHPGNGYREEVTGVSMLWAFLFGWFYFIAKGLWSHVLIQFVVITGTGLLTGGPGALIALPLWIVYALLAPGLLSAKYRKAGWIEEASSSAQTYAAQAPVVDEFKICPHCAERIKAAAKVCRFCNRELTVGDDGPRNLNKQSPHASADLLDELGLVYDGQRYHLGQSIYSDFVDAERAARRANKIQPTAEQLAQYGIALVDGKYRLRTADGTYSYDAPEDALAYAKRSAQP